MYQSLLLRSDRVIALCRMTLAGMLLATGWLDRSYPIMATPAGSALLWSYLGYSVLTLAIAFTDWWLTHRIRPLAFAVDIAAAYAVLYLIEASGLGLVSPFMGFFIFLVVTSTLIWRTRTAVGIAVALVTLYGAIGLILMHNHALADGHWFGRRMAFMAILAVLIIWFGTSRRPDKPARLDWPHDIPAERRFDIIVDYIRQHMRATGVAIFWIQDDEPWTYLGVAGIPGHVAGRLAPDTVDLDSGLAGTAILFDRGRGRWLHLDEGSRIAARRGAARLAPAEFLGIDTGVMIPIAAETGSGVILLTGIPGVSADHLQPAQALGQEIGMAIDRDALAEMSQAARIARLRLSLARDLHDGVAQSLAGVGFRLSALAKVWQQGGDIAPGLAALQSALAQEQQNVQGMIARLRSDEGLSLRGRLLDTLKVTLGNAERRWGIRTTLACSCPDTTLSAFLQREIQQLLDEAVANAVKHGKGGQVDLAVRQSDDALVLAVTNAKGGEAVAEFVPRTIAERVSALGGALAIGTGNGQTVVTLTLPTANDL